MRITKQGIDAVYSVMNQMCRCTIYWSSYLLDNCKSQSAPPAQFGRLSPQFLTKIWELAVRKIYNLRR